MVHRPKTEGPATLYAKTPLSRDRQKQLREMTRAGDVLPLSLVRDLLELELPTRELQAALAACEREPMEAFEAMLLERLAERELAVTLLCLDTWRRATPGHLWPRVAAAAPQLVLHEPGLGWLVEHAWHAGGAEVLRHAVDAAMNQTPDDAILATLLHRLVQWSIEDERVLAMAERILARTYEATIPGALTSYAAAYVARFRPEILFDVMSCPLPPRHGVEVVAAHHALVRSARAVATGVAQFAEAMPATDADYFRELFRVWPPVFLRHEIADDVAAKVVAETMKRAPQVASALPAARAVTWELFAGLSGGIAERPSVASATEGRPPRPDNALRTAFFDRLYREIPAQVPAGDSPWRALLEGLDAPADELSDAKQLDAIRRLPAIFRQCALRFVERVRPRAAFLHEIVPTLPSLEPHELRAAARALVAIGSREALVPAVRVLGNEDVDLDVAFEVCQLLAGKDLGSIRGDVRAVLDQLGTGAARLSRARLELIDAVRSLLTHEAAEGGAWTESQGLEAVDAEVKKIVPDLPKLPADVARALRTARLVQKTFGSMLGKGGVDVGPVVELQYKSLELLFRHRYLARTQAVIDDPRATLPRRLEAIGYGGQGRGRVEQFESYLMGLPVLRDVPAFGKLKLNRLLTSLAQLRPGRRFALDGLKGYAMFFTTFGRFTCEFGLAKLFLVGAPDDKALLELCRDLHTIQDIRNHVVHEGQASATQREVDALWALTSSLIQRVESYAGR